MVRADRVGWTNIAIHKATAKRLKVLKLSGHETYDEVINRLINFLDSKRERWEEGMKNVGIDVQKD